MKDEKNYSCREAVEELWAYIDGELPRDTEKDVHDHLAACRGCYPQYDFQKAFRTFLRRCSHERVPSSLRRRIFLKLLAEEAGNNGEAGPASCRD